MTICIKLVGNNLQRDVAFQGDTCPDDLSHFVLHTVVESRLLRDNPFNLTLEDSVILTWSIVGALTVGLVFRLLIRVLTQDDKTNLNNE